MLLIARIEDLDDMQNRVKLTHEAVKFLQEKIHLDPISPPLTRSFLLPLNDV